MTSTLVLSIAFALAVGCMTAAATAVRSVSRIWLRHWAEQQIIGDTDRSLSALDRPHRYLLAAGTGIAAVVFAFGAVIAYREDRVDLLQQLALAVVLLLFVGQVIPRAIAIRWVNTLVPVLMPVLRVLDVLVGPILGFTARIVRPLLRRDVRPPPLPTDPLEDLLREAEAEGIGEPAESEIISGLVEFGEKRVRDVMTPRARMTSVNSDMSPADLAQAVVRSHYTRIPVLGANDAEVIGVLHAFDVLVHPEEPLLALRAAAVAAPDEACGVVMRRMLRDHRHLAVVRDGDAVVGVVTLEDFVEELVGEILDEHDDPAGGSA
ncbi:MAG: CBS domain-containing protein [Gemmatimonadetes bacterium]|nr:CBS domain-containing protein [Gemmatimonadota bacterium]